MIPFTNKIELRSYYHAEISDEIVTLLPIASARCFPLSFHVKSKEIIKGSLNFYNEHFYRNFKKDNDIDVTKLKIYESERKNETVIIINLLDNCHGHSFLKLIYALKWAKSTKDADFLIIVPRSLFHYIKKNAFTHVVEVNTSYSDLEKCYNLNNVVFPLVEKYKSKFIYKIDTYGIFNKEDLLSQINFFDKSVDNSVKRITFYYRSDFFRKWQGNKQKSNIIELFIRLKPLFSKEVLFTIVGNKDNEVFPDWIIDERAKVYSPENDYKENMIYAQSTITISLTGSHMLIPSILSNCTIHLHPSYKYKNMAEDVISFDQEDPMLHSYKHLYYNGNSDCSDIGPAKLCYLITSHYLGLLEKTYKLNLFEGDQASWIKQNHAYFLYDEVLSYRAAYIEKENKRTRLKYYLSKLFKR